MLRLDDLEVWLPSAAVRRMWRGQIVQHRKRGYRALVVDWDPRCSRSEAWRRRRFEGPSADQPWYSLLIDGDSRSSYVAQEELTAAEDAQRIRHPLLHFYFQGFEAGRYQRNDRPWPGRLLHSEGE